MDDSDGPRWTMPATDRLMCALGRAVYNVAQLELSVERVRRGLAGRFGAGFAGLSAEEVVGALDAVAAAAPAADELPSRLLRVFGRYLDLKARRDALLGAGTRRPALPPCGSMPARAAEAEPRGDAWPLEDILRVARDAEVAAIEANRLLRRHF